MAEEFLPKPVLGLDFEPFQVRAFCEESFGEGKKTQEQGARHESLSDETDSTALLPCHGCFGRFTKPLPCHTGRLRIRRRAEINGWERSLDFIA